MYRRQLLAAGAALCALVLPAASQNADTRAVPKYDARTFYETTVSSFISSRPICTSCRLRRLATLAFLKVIPFLSLDFLSAKSGRSGTA